MRIAVIDSGKGGEYFTEDLRTKLPQDHIDLFTDPDNFPYGNKTQKQLQDILTDRINQLKSQDYDRVYLACNTISIANYGRRFEGIEVRNLAEEAEKNLRFTSNDRVLILGSEYTIDSGFYQRIISSQKLDSYGFVASSLISHIESALDSILIQNSFEHLLADIKSEFDFNQILYACTHFGRLSSSKATVPLEKFLC